MMATAVSIQYMYFGFLPRKYLVTTNKTIMTNQAYEAGFVVKALAKCPVQMFTSDLVSPQPGHGSPVTSIKGHEAPKMLTVDA